MFLLFFLIINSVQSEDVSHAADLLFGDVNAYLEGVNRNYIHLPNINLFGLKCQNGSYGDISSVYRVGPADIFTTSDLVSIKGTLGLERFRISYLECRVLGIFKQNFQLSLSPTMYIEFDIQKRGKKCFLKVKDVAINLDQMSFNTSRRYIGFFENLLIKFSFYLSKNTIIGYLEKEILVYSEKYKKGYFCTKSL